MPTDQEQLRYAIELMRRHFIAEVSEDFDAYQRLTGLICEFVNSYDDRHYATVSTGDYDFPPHWRNKLEYYDKDLPV